MFNRLPLHYIVPAAPPDPLLATANRVKLDLMRFEDDDGEINTMISYEVHGELSEGDGDLLAQLLTAFRTPRTEGGAA